MTAIGKKIKQMDMVFTSMPEVPDMKDIGRMINKKVKDTKFGQKDQNIRVNI